MSTTVANNTNNRTQAIPEQTAPPEQPKKSSKAFPIVLALLVLVGGTFGVTKYLHAQKHEETDDAQVDASINTVIPRISGYITEVKVADNQQVKKGDTLLVLDDRDLRIKLELAEASFVTAQGNLSVAQATTSASRANIATTASNISTIDAQIETARISVRRTTQDYNRYSNLIKDHSITQQQFEQAEAAKQTAEQQLRVLQEQKVTASRQVSAASEQTDATSQQINVANATIMQRRADIDNAKLNLSYTVILAPSDGLVSKVNVTRGQYVQAGQAVFSVVDPRQLWVVANFKETQLKKMTPGQQVDVTVDAYGGKELKAKVSSFAPATGARFSLLPPDNASGNFVKVVQRVPVKIEFANPAAPEVQRLRPGMNVSVDVHVD